MMKVDDFKLLRGFADKQTDKRTDICDCRVAFATENRKILNFGIYLPIFVKNMEIFENS